MFNIITVVSVTLTLLYLAITYFSKDMALFTMITVLFCMFELVEMIWIRFRIRGTIKTPIKVADIGNKTTVVVTIKNRCSFTCNRGKILLEARNLQSRSRNRRWILVSPILPGENEIEFSVPLEEPGKYEFLLHKMKVYGMTGWFHVQIKCRKSAYVQVLPDPLNVAIRLSEAVRNFYGEADVYDDEKAGPDPNEIFQIRPFHDGDRLQSVHWKLSAKSDDLMVKENSFPKACPIVFFLESSEERKRKRFSKEVSKESAFLPIAASISFSLMDCGCPHYFVWKDAKTGDVTRARIDQEESYVLFLYSYLEQGTARLEHSGELMERYQQKYRKEPYLIDLHLTGELELIQGEKTILQLGAESYKEELEGFELVL